MSRVLGTVFYKLRQTFRHDFPGYNVGTVSSNNIYAISSHYLSEVLIRKKKKKK